MMIVLVVHLAHYFYTISRDRSIAKMPRRNRTPKISRILPKPSSDSTKRVFKTRKDAEKAIEEIALYRPEVQLDAYQSPEDNLWRLTSKTYRNYS